MHVVCKHIWITKIVADNVWDWTRQFIPKVWRRDKIQCALYIHLKKTC
jgi:hypothetical protein